jgi:electron transport complex protein RnfA
MNSIYLVLNFFFIQNLLLVFGLGMTPALRQGQAYRMRWGALLSMSVLMLVACLAAWGLHALLVTWLGLSYLQTMSYVLVLVCLIYATRAVAKRSSAARQDDFQALVLPVNISSASLGLMVLVTGQGFGFLDALAASCGGILGYGLALFLYGEALQRMELEWIPKPFRGLPLALISLGLVSLVFMSVSALLLPGIR